MTREDYLTKGICPNCRCREIEKPYTSCSTCRKAMSKWMWENRAKKDFYNKTRYDTLRQLGLCIDCKNPTGGNVYCRDCTNIRCARRALRKPLHSRNRWSKRG